MRHVLTKELSIPSEGINTRYADLSVSEVDRGGERCIGGDQGDIYFSGFTVRDDAAVLNSPELETPYDDLTPDEAYSLAETILWESFNSIGVAAVY